MIAHVLIGHWRHGLKITDGKGYILFFQKCQEMKGEVENKQKKMWDLEWESWGQVCVKCSQSSSLSKKEGQPPNTWGKELISGGLRKWTHSEQPPWRVGVVNLERTRSGPQSWLFTQGTLPRFLEDELKSRVFLPHQQCLDYICKEQWHLSLSHVGSRQTSKSRHLRGQSMQLLLSGVDMADSESFLAGKETELIWAGLNWPVQTSNWENLPSFILSLIFKSHFKYPVNTFRSKDWVKTILLGKIRFKLINDHLWYWFSFAFRGGQRHFTNIHSVSFGNRHSGSDGAFPTSRNRKKQAGNIYSA